MPFEIRDETDLAAMKDSAPELADPRGGTRSVIQRVEDILPVESYAIRQVDWVVEGIFPMAASRSSAVIPAPGNICSRHRDDARNYPREKNYLLGRRTRQCPVLILDAENPIVAVAERLHRLQAQTGDNLGY